MAERGGRGIPFTKRLGRQHKGEANVDDDVVEMLLIAILDAMETAQQRGVAKKLNNESDEEREQ
jgi:hypothetical protein